MSRHSPNLYELAGLRDLRCTLCPDFTIPPGPMQRTERNAHALVHTRAGEVVAIHSGLGDGAVYYEVRHTR